MTTNPIPDNLRVDHLFLLVGSNPLPDWVAARLLLRGGGRLYLVHSDDTLATAQELARYLMENHNYEKPALVEVRNPWRARTVYDAIQDSVRKIGHGTIGLNYTGGTKVMSAHSHRALDQSVRAGLPPVVFSYLEARTCTMRFDDDREFLVGLADETKLNLQDLFKLHDEFALAPPAKKTNALPVAALLLEANAELNGYSNWKSFCWNNLKYRNRRDADHVGKRVDDIKSDVDARRVVLALSGRLSQIAERLIPGGSDGRKTLGEIVDRGQWGFKDAEALAAWLDGGWLEHQTAQLIADNQSSYKVDDFGRNITTRLKRFPAINKFEIDVAAMRGYQLHVFSCYSGSDKARAKQKLFEAFTRAQQLGGDQARAALVCCSNDPEAIEREVAQDWDLKDRVKVFGQKHLLKLRNKENPFEPGELQQWFDAGAKEA